MIEAIVDAAFVPGLLCGIVDDSLAHFVAFRSFPVLLLGLSQRYIYDHMPRF